MHKHAHSATRQKLRREANSPRIALLKNNLSASGGAPLPQIQHHQAVPIAHAQSGVGQPRPDCVKARQLIHLNSSKDCHLGSYGHALVQTQ